MARGLVWTQGTDPENKKKKELRVGLGQKLFLRRDEAKRVGSILNYIKSTITGNSDPNKTVTLLKGYYNRI